MRGVPAAAVRFRVSRASIVTVSRRAATEEQRARTGSTPRHVRRCAPVESILAPSIRESRRTP